MVKIVSIIISVFNGEKWIDNALNNLLKQEFRNYELLIINDGSTDKTEEKILSFVKLNNRIRYLPKKHTGLTDSLNYGLNNASGKWIARIDVDDISHQKRLFKQLEFVKNNKNLVLVGSNFYIKKNNKTLYKSNLPSDHNRLIYRLRNMKGFFPHSSAFFLREKAIQVGGYRSAFKKAQDHDLWLRLSEVGQISCTKEFLVVINEHKNRITNSKVGKPQDVYAFTSIISHYLRINNQEFLEIKIRNKNIEDFLNKVEIFLKRSNFYKFNLFKKNLKKTLIEKNKFRMIKDLIKLILKNKDFLFLTLKTKLFGTRLPYKFFLEMDKSH